MIEIFETHPWLIIPIFFVVYAVLYYIKWGTLSDGQDEGYGGDDVYY